MSEGPTELQAPAPPPPSTRSLELVLRDALEAGEEVRLVVGKGLADSAAINPAAYANVELEGVSVPVPKLAGASLGGPGSGYPVYLLATKDFLLALGTVGGPQSGSAVPIGAILPYAGAAAPTGYLLADGSGFSSVTYPLLASLLGGTTLPDLRKRVPVGAGSGLGRGSTDGLAEGSRHPLHHHHLTAGVSVTAVGDHSHPSAGAHQHGPLGSGPYLAETGLGLTGAAGTARYSVSDGFPNTASAGDHSHPAAGGHGHSASVDADTSGGGPSNGPSYYVLNFIIRAA